MPLNSTFYFYNIIKSEITFEPYLEINEYERRRAFAQLLRSSNDRLNCETGRYDLNKSLNSNSKLGISWDTELLKDIFSNENLVSSGPLYPKIVNTKAAKKTKKPTKQKDTENKKK